MNKALGLAAVAMAGTTLLHLIGGGVAVHQPLLQAVPSAELGGYVSLLWHFVSVFLGVCAVAFGLAAWNTRRWRGVALSLAGLTVAMGVMFLIYGLVRLGTPFVTPQWVLLVPIGALAIWPLRQASHSPQ